MIPLPHPHPDLPVSVASKLGTCIGIRTRHSVETRGRPFRKLGHGGVEPLSLALPDSFGCLESTTSFIAAIAISGGDFCIHIYIYILYVQIYIYIYVNLGDSKCNNICTIYIYI